MAVAVFVSPTLLFFPFFHRVSWKSLVTTKSSELTKCISSHPDKEYCRAMNFVCQKHCDFSGLIYVFHSSFHPTTAVNRPLASAAPVSYSSRRRWRRISQVVHWCLALVSRTFVVSGRFICTTPTVMLRFIYLGL